MSDPNIEGNKEAPEILNQEDEQFLKGLEGQGFDLKGREKEPAEKPKEEAPKEEAPKEPEPPKKEEPPKEDAPKEEEPKEKKPAREPKFVPAWQMKVAEKNWQKEKAELLKAIEEKSKQNNQDEPEKKAGKPDEKLKALIAKHQLDEELVTDLVDIISSQNKIPDDVSKKLSEIESERNERLQEQAYDKEFSEKVLPLIRQEYPGISEVDVSSIRNDLKESAFSEGFISVPLDVIYKGVDDFRKRAADAGKKSFDAPRSGDKPLEKKWEDLTEEEVGKLSNEDFKKWSDAMEKRK